LDDLNKYFEFLTLLRFISLGTHLYVLYEGYGYSVSYLYCLGFATGGLMSPITGPLVDKIGRKKSAILYCCLEMLINYMEQRPYLWGLVLCRVIGGFTTNLLSSVFETWLDTEYRRRGFAKDKYEIIMRDSVIVSNVAAIFSGYLSHVLATRYGTVGPFQGAVTCTAVALAVVCFIWTENYGSSDGHSETMMGYFKEAVTAFRNDQKMLTIGILQGLTTGSIHIFIFLWAPTLRNFARTAPPGTWGVDVNGEPAYGLIFGAFMGAGVAGGLVAPRLRKVMTALLSPIVDENLRVATVEIEGEGNVSIRPMAVEFLASSCYFFSALSLFVPWMCSENHAMSFTHALMALLFFEFMIGIFMPCEGVIRSLYFPTNARASIMTLPRIVVNAAVAVGVLSTNFIT
jgi:MFS transporter, MFS domain-containing protein family, molybdate-anion transporter